VRKRFAGWMPVDIEKQFADSMEDDDEEGGKKIYTKKNFQGQLKRLKKDNLRFPIQRFKPSGWQDW